MLMGDVPRKNAGGPQGSAYPITEEWRVKVKLRLAELQMSQAELARRVGCTGAAITNVLRDNQQSSLIPAIHMALGWDVAPLPETAGSIASADAVDEISSIAREFPPEYRDQALAWMRMTRDILRAAKKRR